MQHISPAKSALSVGSVIGLYHFTWSLLVALGIARPVMDFVLRLHFIQLSYELAPFALATAAALVALTFTIGAALGFAFALVWNWLADRRAVAPAMNAPRRHAAS